MIWDHPQLYKQQHQGHAHQSNSCQVVAKFRGIKVTKKSVLSALKVKGVVSLPHELCPWGGCLILIFLWVIPFYIDLCIHLTYTPRAPRPAPPSQYPPLIFPYLFRSTILYLHWSCAPHLCNTALASLEVMCLYIPFPHLQFPFGFFTWDSLASIILETICRWLFNALSWDSSAVPIPLRGKWWHSSHPLQLKKLPNSDQVTETYWRQ